MPVLQKHINCTLDISFFNIDSENIRVGVWDKDFKNEIPKLKSSILSIVKTIDNRLKSGKKVLVHCGAGQSRSPTVIACYLLYINRNLSVDAAVNLLKEKNSNTFFGRISFKEILEYVVSIRDSTD